MIFELLMSDVQRRDLVTDLPTSVSCFFLSNWVSVVDLARFDSAYCCHEKRGVVLDMLQSTEFLCTDDLQSHKIIRSLKQCWDWILRRNIKLFHVKVSTFGADVQKLESYARRHERYVGHLDLAEVESSSFALHFMHLVQLTCDVTLNPSFKAALKNNPSLQILDLRGLQEKHIESFKTIRLHHLTQLRLEVDECSAELLAAVLAMPARLLKLDLSYINTDLSGVAQHCPHLRSLSISMQFYGTEDRFDFNLAEFTSHLPHLVNLQLVDITDLDDAMVLAFVRNLKQLRFVSLQFCEKCKLTDAGIEHIAEHCAATLEVFGLRLSYAGTNITRASLDQLRARCTTLRQFRVEASFGWQGIPLDIVTTLRVADPCCDGTLVQISNECPQLEVLQLRQKNSDCSLPNLRALCQKCPKLYRIEVHKFVVSYWKSLAATLPQLRVTDSLRDKSLDVMSMPI